MNGPDDKGRFGKFGGRFVSETLMPLILELEKQYEKAKTDKSFWSEMNDLWTNYVGRPSPLYFAERLTNHLGGAKVYFKRDELNHTGAHKINNVLGQIILAKRMGKTRIIAETGAGQHGVPIDEFVANYERKKDSDIWTSESFRNLNSAQKYGAVVEWVEGKVRDYDPSNNEKMQNAVTPEEYKAAEHAASLDLYKTLGDLNPALVQKHVIKKQKELEAAAFSKWNQKRTREIKAERQKIARSQLISCHENGQGGCAVNYLNERSPYIGNTAAKQELMSQYLAMAKNGDLTSNKILDL